MIKISRVKQPYWSERWMVTDTRHRFSDLVPTFHDALKYALWYLGIPYRWLYHRSKH